MGNSRYKKWKIVQNKPSNSDFPDIVWSEMFKSDKIFGQNSYIEFKNHILHVRTKINCWKFHKWSMGELSLFNGNLNNLADDLILQRKLMYEFCHWYNL